MSLKLANLALIVAVAAAGCEVSTRVTPVGSEFLVKVMDQGRAVIGLTIMLDRDEVFTGVTGPDGIVLFRNVAPGIYELWADHDVGRAAIRIEVKADGPAQVVVPFDRSGRTPAVARSLKSGVLHLPNYRPFEPQPEVSLDLLDEPLGRVLQSARTNERGSLGS